MGSVYKLLKYFHDQLEENKIPRLKKILRETILF